MIPPRRPAPRAGSEVSPLLWLVIGALLLFWLVGVATNVAGALVHILLAVIVVVVVMQLLRGRRSA
jgi:Flp pilus assembly protein TadB